LATRVLIKLDLPTPEGPVITVTLPPKWACTWARLYPVVVLTIRGWYPQLYSFSCQKVMASGEHKSALFNTKTKGKPVDMGHFRSEPKLARHKYRRLSRRRQHQELDLLLADED